MAGQVQVADGIEPISDLRGSADYRAAQGVLRSILVRVVNESYDDDLAALAASTVPEGVRTLGEREGFPEMGVLDVCVHRNRENASEAANCLADYIAGSFI